MTALLLILELWATLGQANPQRQAQIQATYRIGGVVVDAETNVPVARAQVSISFGDEQANSVAGDEGRFAFEGLPAGKYVLSAAAPGYLHEGYQQHGGFFVGIATGKDQDSEHILFPLHPEAAIFGRVNAERRYAVLSWPCSLLIP